MARKAKTTGCPPQCGYGARQDQLDAPTPKERVFNSTCAPMNGDPDNDAYRDMDGFDVDEELARLRLAIREPMFVGPKATKLARFVAEAFHNIDRSLVREGDRPQAWLAARRPRAKKDDGPAPKAPLSDRVSEAMKCGEKLTKREIAARLGYRRNGAGFGLASALTKLVRCGILALSGYRMDHGVSMRVYEKKA